MTSLVDAPTHIGALRRNASFDRALELEEVDTLGALLARCSPRERQGIDSLLRTLREVPEDHDPTQKVAFLKEALRELLIKYDMADKYVVGVCLDAADEPGARPSVHVVLRPFHVLVASRSPRRKTY